MSWLLFTMFTQKQKTSVSPFWGANFRTLPHLGFWKLREGDMNCVFEDLDPVAIYPHSDICYRSICSHCQLIKIWRMNSQLDSARLLKTAVCRIVIRLAGVMEVAIFDIYFSDYHYGYICLFMAIWRIGKGVTCSYKQFFISLGLQLQYICTG